MKSILLTTLTVFALSVTGLMSGCSEEVSKSNAKAKFSKVSGACGQAIAAANAENKKAKKVGFEWRDTSKLIKQAKKSSGKKCVELANTAKGQAVFAQQQAKEQANAGPVF